MRRRGWRDRGVALLAVLLLACASVAAPVRLRAAAQTEPFYAAPADLPEAPGALLRHEAFDRGLPENARADRILYTTTGLDGAIRVASALVIRSATPAEGPRPVVLWAHGATGIAQRCAPSLLDDPLGSGAMPAQQEAIDAGWVVVAPDYIGLGTAGPHPFLIGQADARSALDAVRAARQLDGIALGDRTVVWGHSQGGGIALWVGSEGKAYAPDVPIAGIAAVSPAADLPAIAAEIQETPLGSLFGLLLLRTYSDVYSDVRPIDYLARGAGERAAEIIERCFADPETFLSLGTVLVGPPLIRGAPEAGPLGGHLADNIPPASTGIPTLVAQGTADPLVSGAVQAAYVSRLCAAGQIVDFRAYAGVGHLDIVADGSPLVPDLVEWTEDRFAGDSSATGCSTVRR